MSSRAFCAFVVCVVALLVSTLGVMAMRRSSSTTKERNSHERASAVVLGEKEGIANRDVESVNACLSPAQPSSVESRRSSTDTTEDATTRMLAALRRLALQHKEEHFDPTGDEDDANPRRAMFDGLVNDLFSSPDASVAAIKLLAGPLSLDERLLLWRAIISRHAGQAQKPALAFLLDIAPRLADAVARRDMFKVLRWWLPEDSDSARAFTAQVLAWYASEQDSKLREELLEVAAPYARDDEAILDLLVGITHSDQHDRAQRIADERLSSMAVHDTPSGCRGLDALLPILQDPQVDPVRRDSIVMVINSSLISARDSHSSAHLHDTLVPWASRIVRDEREPMHLRVKALGLLGLTDDAQAIQGALALLPSAAAQRASDSVLGMMAEFTASRQLTDVFLAIATNPPPDVSPKTLVGVLGEHGDERALPILQRMGAASDTLLQLQVEAVMKKIRDRAHAGPIPR